MKPQVTYNRKLAGSVFLALRILFDMAIIVGCAIKYFPIKFEFPSYAFLVSTFLDGLMCSCFLLFPRFTCEGNTYIKCLPFAVNSYICNILVYPVEIVGPNVPPKDERIPYIVTLNIITLLMYGGLASPLNMAWMETFKPFSIVILKNRRLSQVNK